MVCEHKPHQCTLVPDPPGVLTSSEGWDTINRKEELIEVVKRLQGAGVRVSLFLDPKEDLVKAAKETGADRIEFYTGNYAHNYHSGKELAVKSHIAAAKVANQYDLGINAGHDLNLDNLNYYKSSVPQLLEVSIGHALVCDSLYYGLKNIIQMYLHQLKK
jgi:pyridoxine 5-phosphate synthase